MSFSKLSISILFVVSFIGCSSPVKSTAADQSSTNVDKKAAASSATANANAQVVEVERTNPFTGKEQKVNVEVQTIDCKKGASTRSIVIEHKDKNKAPDGTPMCFVKYKKEGLMKVVAKANYQRKRCAEVAENLEKNLEKSGYVCQGH